MTGPPSETPASTLPPKVNVQKPPLCMKCGLMPINEWWPAHRHTCYCLEFRLVFSVLMLLFSIASCRGAKYCNKAVCPRTCLKTQMSKLNSPNLQRAFSVAVTWPSCGGVTILYVLAVFWITSCLHRRREKGIYLKSFIRKQRRWRCLMFTIAVFSTLY